MQYHALRHQGVHSCFDRWTQTARIERLDGKGLWAIRGRIAPFNGASQRRQCDGTMMSSETASLSHVLDALIYSLSPSCSDVLSPAAWIKCGFSPMRADNEHSAVRSRRRPDS